MDAFKAVTSKAGKESKSRKAFSVEMANRALPLVRRIVVDIVNQYCTLVEVQKHYQELLRQGPSETLESARDRRQAVAGRLSELTDELEAIGCELKDYERGIVDFPAVLDGREVYLCWKLGEDTVDSWHELIDGYAGRRALPVRRPSR